MQKSYTILTFLLASFFIININAATTRIYTIDINKDIGTTTWLYVQSGINAAEKNNSDIIILHINTYGGEVVYADSIRTKILNCPIPVIAFIDNNAASAGALISIACDKIYMRPGGNIGAATVVGQTGEAMPDKYQSYMRSTMRSTAEAHGQDTIVSGKDTTFAWFRDPHIAEAMVDDRIVVPGVSDSGKTLTFTALEAVKFHYCEGIAENITEIIEKHLQISDYSIEQFKPTTWLNLKGFLSSSLIQALLIMLIIGGIYFELQTPGIGFPLVLAISAAVLYFAPLYMDGLAANWEILIFIIGLGLIALEIFVVPGFGITGVSGIILVIGGLTLSLLGNVNFDFKAVNGNDAAKASFTVIGGLTVGFALILYLSSKIGSKGIFRKIALTKSLETSDGYVGVPMETANVVGKTGVAYTVLRLSGKVQIDDEVYDAFSEDGFIEKGTPVKVLRYETGQIYVKRVEN
ncbi:MAG: nodulation protein NfeD [Paludibacter sp.]|jgi:membrane-bound serine protease (ClpP class)|nr:nodulation protein NfeD [Paludibacter sp.]